MKKVIVIGAFAVVAYEVGKLKGYYEMAIALAAASQYPEVENRVTNIVKSSLQIYKCIERLKGNTEE